MPMMKLSCGADVAGTGKKGWNGNCTGNGNGNEKIEERNGIEPWLGLPLPFLKQFLRLNVSKEKSEIV